MCGKTRAMTSATAKRPEVSPIIEEIWMAGPVKPFQFVVEELLGVEGCWTDVEGAAVRAVGFEAVPASRSEDAVALGAFVVGEAVNRSWVQRKMEGRLVGGGLRADLAVCLAADEGDAGRQLRWLLS
jgi:hypothetical protein